MASSPLPVLPPQRSFGETLRRDAWWVSPLTIFIILGGFVVYATWAAFQNAYYMVDGTGYLSPFYSPEIWGSHDALLGPKPAWWPAVVPFSPALLILPFPGLFRFTCYYYRGAYYKAFWSDPAACAVGEPRKKYLGENSLPLILQNVHRYFLYVAVIFLFILAWDVYKAMWFDGPTGATEFGIGLGTVILAVNVVFLSCYTLGCHAMRHIVGGYLDQLSRKPVRKAAYDCSSCLNRWHMKWAYMSLFSVAFSDIYIRLVAMGIWHDIRFI
jgi:hypothetical protein